jgi:hypothetical protein
VDEPSGRLPLFSKIRGDWRLLHPEFRTGTTTAFDPREVGGR